LDSGELLQNLFAGPAGFSHLERGPQVTLCGPQTVQNLVL
jgi:hypothetical protein